MLWHLLLFGGWQVAHSELVLPITSFLVAGAAVTLLVLRAPFPRWVTALVVFGLPAYEYSVMARNYGIAMLLLFAFAALYPARQRHPFALAAILAVLCNTNAHSAIFAGLLTESWLWDTFVAERYRADSSEALRVFGALPIILLGLGFAVWTFWPTPDSLTMGRTDLKPASAWRAAEAFAAEPAQRFASLMPAIVHFPPVGPYSLASPVLILSLVGLVGRPVLLAAGLAGLAALGVFFTVVHVGYYRHQALFVAFLLCLYWMAFNRGDGPPPPRWLHGLSLVGLYGGLPLLLACVIATTAVKIEEDWARPVSASREFGEFLQRSPEHRRSVLLAEPEYLIESMPYYVNNRIYIARERRFGRIVNFLASVKPDLSLGELLCAAWQAKRQAGGNALVALGPPIASASLPWDAGARSPLVQAERRTFRWSEEDVALWRRHATPVARFGEQVSASDERYLVFAIAEPQAGADTACPR